MVEFYQLLFKIIICLYLGNKGGGTLPATGINKMQSPRAGGMDCLLTVEGGEGIRVWGRGGRRR